MRYMVLVKATAESESGEMPESPEVFEEMNRFNEARQGRRAAVGRGTAPELAGRQGALQWHGADRHRRPVRRDQGSSPASGSWM